MRRKILMGVLALAFPVGILAGTTSVASASTPTNSISCTGFSATITFNVPYVYTMPGHVQGTATASKTGGSTTVVGSPFTCGGVGGQTFNSITIPPGKNDKLAKTDPRYNKTTGVKYLEGDAAGFFGSGAKSLKKSLKNITFHINGHTTGFKQSGSPSLVTGNAPCPGEAGYIIHGKVASSGTGDFYYNKSAVLNVCLGSDTGSGTTGSFLNDLFSMKLDTAPASMTITGATIDPSDSNATL